MDDEFSVVYPPKSTNIVDPDVGDTTPLVDLLKRTYLKKPDERLIFSQTMWRPSLVARSDAELYDVEDPRWAKRVHVFVKTPRKQNYVGFVNMRALNIFMQRLTPSLKKHLQTIPLPEGHLICGAYLTPPKSLIDEGFMFPISSDLGIYHNELSGWKGTVYSTPMRIWGGMCSQACVYMATHPMVKHGGNILGVSDITLAASPGKKYTRAESIKIKGLTLPQIRKVFESQHLSLKAFWEKVAFRSRYTKIDPFFVNRAASVIVAYLTQGFPVILAVKCARLIEANPDHYSTDLQKTYGRGSEQEKDHYKNNLHTILLVGYKPPSGSNPYYEFVYNDSLSRPYITISVDKLAAGAADSSQKNKKPFVFEFIVPVPKYLGTPLNMDFNEFVGPPPSYKINRHKERKRGLWASSKHWKDEVALYETGRTTEPPCSFQGFFPLKSSIRTTSFRLVRVDDFFHRYVSLNVPDRLEAYEKWQDFEKWLPKILWVEEFIPSVKPEDDRLEDHTIQGLWAWSAENRYPKDNHVEVPILQVLHGTLSVDYDDCQGDIQLKRHLAIKVRKPNPLQIGAITSFHVGPMKTVLEASAFYRIPNVDLFAFQQNDLKNYFKASTNASPLQVVSSNKVKPQQIARQIARDVSTIQKVGNFPFVVRGFATYFPEISSLNDNKRKLAISALQNIIRIAGILNSRRYGKNYGFDCRFIEIVAGTKISEPQLKSFKDPKTGKKRSVVEAQKAGYYSKLEALLRSLSDLSKTARENDVYIVIEIEPGLLPFFSERTYLDTFVSALDGKLGRGMPKVRFPERIGINIDVNHMWLCGIKPQDLRRKSIRNRIGHVHFGDIGPGHSSDLVTGVIHNFDQYREWFSLFTDIANELPRGDCLPDFSSCLSIEIEACRDKSMVAAAYHRAKLLLSRYQEQKALV